MSEKFGFQAFSEPQQFSAPSLPPAFSEETSRKIDEEVERLTREAYGEATRLLGENKDKLELLAKTLIERETMDGREVEELLDMKQSAQEEKTTPESGPAAGEDANA